MSAEKTTADCDSNQRNCLKQEERDKRRVSGEKTIRPKFGFRAKSWEITLLPRTHAIPGVSATIGQSNIVRLPSRLAESFALWHESGSDCERTQDPLKAKNATDNENESNEISQGVERSYRRVERRNR